jgi:hypothetical protein
MEALDPTEEGGLPVQRAVLALSDNLCSLLPTHKYALTLFEPIPITD